MNDLSYFIKELVASSQFASLHQQGELAGMQELAAGFLGMAQVDGREPFVFKGEQEYPALNSEQVREAFKVADLKVAVSEDQERLLILGYVDSEQAADGYPVFLQNFLAVEMLPAVVLLCVERLPVTTQRKMYMTMPYFVIQSLTEEWPKANVALALEVDQKVAVQQELDRAQQDQSDSIQAKALADMGPCLRMAPAAMAEALLSAAGA